MSTTSEINFKTPKYQTKIHLPSIPGSFTFKKNGKLRLDQQVKKFCLLNKCIGCFELKVHLNSVNPKKIEYDANQNGININTFADQKKYKLFVKYPDGLTLEIGKNPEAQFYFGILSCKLPIIKYNKLKLFKFIKKPKSFKKYKDMQIIKKNDIKSNGNRDPVKQKDNVMHNKNDKKRIKNDKKKTKKNKRKRKLSLNELNKRIANNKPEPGPVAKKRKIVKNNANGLNEMSVNDQFELIDGVVNKIENKEKEKRIKDMEKQNDVKEYLQRKADKKKLKQQKRNELREKFLKKRNSKKKNKNKIKTHAGSSGSTKTVRFDV